MSRRRKWILGIGIPLVVLLGVTLISPMFHRAKTATFHVTVPESTPVEDAIILHVELDLHPMKMVAPHVYEATVDVRDLGFNEARRYGYSRGGFFIFGEYGFGINVGQRTFKPGIDRLMNDTVTEWRWFPVAREADPVIQSEAGTRPIAARTQFMAGPDLVDFWNPGFPYQFNATTAHLASQGYEWIQLDPPWDYSSLDPPVISNEGLVKAQWTLEEERNQIRVFRDAGFKVYLGPQVCCTKISFENRSDEWWHQWYGEYADFLQAHADIARQEGVDAFSFSAPPETMPGERHAPPFAQEGWEKIFVAARSAGVPLGIGIFPPVPDGDNLHEPWPPEAVQFAPKVDFIAMPMWDWVVDQDNPTPEEIQAGYDSVFRRVDHAHDILQKPIVFAQVAYFSHHGAARPKGAEVLPTWADPHDNATRYDGKLQAEIYESLLRHVADRPFIEGLFPFGYWYVDAPLNLDSDIRDKPAERVLSQWLDRFPTG
jgi:hypothetical protein